MTVVEQVVARSRDRNHPEAASLASLAAERFARSDDYARLVERNGLSLGNARIGEVLSSAETARFLSAAAAPGAAFGPSEMDPVIRGISLPGDMPARMLRLLDFVPLIPTTSTLIRFARETTRDDVAAETAPGTDAPDAEYELEPLQREVRDITVTLTVLRDQLNDRADLKLILSTKLGGSVRGRLERQLVQGDNSDPNLEGILSVSGFATVDRDVTNELAYDTVRRGILAVRTNAREEPSAIALSANDYDYILNERDGDDHLVVSGAERASRTLFGIPVVPTHAVDDGTAIVGAWDIGVAVRLRSGLELFVSDQHLTHFTERKAELLASMRAAVIVRQPSAFARVTL